MWYSTQPPSMVWAYANMQSRVIKSEISLVQRTVDKCKTKLIGLEVKVQSNPFVLVRVKMVPLFRIRIRSDAEWNKKGKQRIATEKIYVANTTGVFLFIGKRYLTSSSRRASGHHQFVGNMENTICNQPSEKVTPRRLKFYPLTMPSF